MAISGTRVGVVGGSIAGCAVATACARLGCDVTVFERHSGELRDRGSGIGVPQVLRDELVARGYLSDGYRCWPADDADEHVRASGTRVWTIADGTDAGRVVWRQPGFAAVVANNWSVLWSGLRSAASVARYLDGVRVAAVVPDDGGAIVRLDDGTEHWFDVVFGADGYRSIVRPIVAPGSEPRYAGYILWRGNFPESELSDRDAWDEVLATLSPPVVGFDGGHAVAYPIPDFENSREGLRVNWAIYGPKPDALVLDGPSSIPPGGISPEVFSAFESLRESVIPPRLKPLFAGDRTTVSIQPIYDETVDRYVSGRVALIGDAATLARPHTGSGATKAMQDAMLIETLGSEHADWDALLVAYGDDRIPEGRSRVELGRRIGRDQVERTPPWERMSAEDFSAWAAGSLSGDSLYFYGDSDAAEPSS